MKEKDLEDLTRRYWKEGWNVERYIQELLPEELEYLRKPDRIITKPAEILVQLVGFSWDPLLISLCLYKPEKLVLILNERYGKQDGAARGDKYKELVSELIKNELITEKERPEIAPSPWKTVKDTPQDVFKFLEKHVLPLLNEGKRVVVDITGAKKSMVSGAYLFAAYTNASVCYVDFDKFSEEKGRPYGYTCRISELENPMELFKLGEWDIVSQLYNSYAFWRAKELIEEIKRGVESFLEKRELNCIELLKEWLEFYRLWDDGDYKGSWLKFKEIRRKIPAAECPTAVEKLGEIWPDKGSIQSLKGGINSLKSIDNLEESIYLKDEEVLIYAHDELAKIGRLIEYGEDYRSALLRASGLNEFLLKARVIRLWMYNKFVVEKDNKVINRGEFEAADKLLWDNEILKFSAALYLLNSLRWRPERPIYCMRLSQRGTEGEIRAHRSEDATQLEEFWKEIENSAGMRLPNDVFDLRNDAIHFCLSVPREMAEVAVKMAEKNLEDFEVKWVKKTFTSGKFEAMDWDKLCDVCGIDFLPRRR